MSIRFGVSRKTLEIPTVMLSLKLCFECIYNKDDVTIEINDFDQPVIELLSDIIHTYNLQYYDINSKEKLKTQLFPILFLYRYDGNEGNDEIDADKLETLEEYNDNGNLATLNDYNIKSGDTIVVGYYFVPGEMIVGEIELPDLQIKYNDAINAITQLHGFTHVRDIQKYGGLTKLYSHTDYDRPFQAFLMDCYGKTYSVANGNARLIEVFGMNETDTKQPVKFLLAASFLPHEGKLQMLRSQMISWIQAKLNKFK